MEIHRCKEVVIGRWYEGDDIRLAVPEQATYAGLPKVVSTRTSQMQYEVRSSRRSPSARLF